MAYSNQQAVSDGTLVALTLSLDYFDRSEISVFFDGVLVLPGGRWSWVGSTSKSLTFNPAVPPGTVVFIQRNTNVLTARNVFGLGAQFLNRTLDENFTQVMRVAQEAKEGSYFTDSYRDINMHGYRLRNLGTAQLPADAVTLNQHQDDLVKVIAAAEAAAAAAASEAALLAALTVDRGDWQPATLYNRANLVYLSATWDDPGLVYVALLDHTSGATFVGDKAKWEVYRGATRTASVTGTFVNARDLGVVGDYNTDDTIKFEAACYLCAAAKKTLDITDMNIRVTRSIDLPSGLRLRGNGGANIQTWLASGDKLLMRPGYKNQISGSNIFVGNASKRYYTNRTDGWASFSYGLSYLNLEPYKIDGVGIILDCDIYNAAGAQTVRATDNRGNCDVGLVVRSHLATIQDSNLFGYWGKASFVVHSQQTLENVDSDYIRAVNTNFTSIALVGDSTGMNGLTGFSGLGCGYYSAADHHNPPDGDYTIPSIFVDGALSTVTVGGIRGHRFHGNLRTHSNIVVDLVRCQDVVLELVTETPAIAGVTNANTPGVIRGEARTGNVTIISPANANTVRLGLDALAASIGGSFISLGGVSNSEILVARAGKGVRIGQDGTGDGYFQLTADFQTVNAGWMFRRDGSNGDALSVRYDNVEKFQLTTDGELEIDGPLRFSSTQCKLLAGEGAPEGVVTAYAGSIYMRTDGGTGATMYVKESGTTNTGWIAK